MGLIYLRLNFQSSLVSGIASGPHTLRHCCTMGTKVLTKLNIKKKKTAVDPFKKENVTHPKASPLKLCKKVKH